MKFGVQKFEAALPKSVVSLVSGVMGSVIALIVPPLVAVLLLPPVSIGLGITIASGSVSSSGVALVAPPLAVFPVVK